LTCDIIIIIIIITACCRKIRKRFMECSRNRGGESDAEKFFSASLTGGKGKKQDSALSVWVLQMIMTSWYLDLHEI